MLAFWGLFVMVTITGVNDFVPTILYKAGSGLATSNRLIVTHVCIFPLFYVFFILFCIFFVLGSVILFYFYLVCIFYFFILFPFLFFSLTGSQLAVFAQLF
jgi:hypothetical protein